MKTLMSVMAALVASVMLMACSTAPESESKRDALVQEADAALTRMKAADPSLNDVMQRSYGYAIFPSVGKGGVGVGGAYGRGVVVEQGKMIGFTDLSQATIGFQLGGQEYTELLVFEDQKALDRFKREELEFSAQASAVALKAGAAAGTNFKDGVAVFTQTNAGLMYEATIGGQKFSYQPSGQ
jgi:lipid-binding SYLF domain-containing protein